MEAMREYWKRYLVGWLRKKRCVFCGDVNWPPNHPGGVAFIKRKNKRLGCQPITKQ